MAQPASSEQAQAAAPSRCFICLGDAGEEGDISDWVHPCPCSLEAHHACLLQWVDECDREDKALKCPVCQTPIRVEGARDLVVDFSDGLRNVVNGLSPALVGTMMGGAVMAGQALYGFHAVRTFAGDEALLGLLGSGRLRESLPALLGVPLIAPGIVFWQLFPGFTTTVTAPFSILYSATFLNSPETLAWPPPPQLALSSLPCIAMAYIKLKNELFGSMEARWDRVIRGLPEADEAEQAAAPDRAEGLLDMINNLADELQGGPDDEPGNDRVEVWFDEAGMPNEAALVIDIIEELDDEEEEEEEEEEEGDGGDLAHPPARRDHEDAPAHGDHEGERPQGDQGQLEVAREPHPQGVVAPEQPQDLPQEGQPEPVRLPRPAPQPARQARPPGAERPIRYSIRDLTSTILGALLLPSISWAAGELLRLTLPKAWTSTPGFSRAFIFASPLRFGPTGLMQERWGRSLVGGCAYVVLKDMFRLYVKYRRAAIRPMRRVPNVKPARPRQ